MAVAPLSCADANETQRQRQKERKEKVFLSGKDLCGISSHSFFFFFSFSSNNFSSLPLTLNLFRYRVFSCFVSVSFPSLWDGIDLIFRISIQMLYLSIYHLFSSLLLFMHSSLYEAHLFISSPTALCPQWFRLAQIPVSPLQTLSRLWKSPCYLYMSVPAFIELDDSYLFV